MQLRSPSSPASTVGCCLPFLPLPRLPRLWGPAGERPRGLFPGRVGIVCGSQGDRWNLKSIDREAVQERLSSWLLKAQTLITDVAAPLVSSGQGKLATPQMDLESVETKDVPVPVYELTVNRMTPRGMLSLEAATSVEQFSRMIGLTGRKMQQIFEAQAPETVRDDVRNFVEYCCFRYLSRDNSNIHPSLKEPAFQRLIFITMLAWEKPYSNDENQHNSSENLSLKRKVVGEEAFVRIAPAIEIVADWSTAHHLFRVIAGDEKGISLSLWMTYVAELLKVHDGRRTYKIHHDIQPPNEELLCIASSRKRPVLKWEENIAWPGDLTLTNRALYFKAIGVAGYREPIRLDLTLQGSQVKKTKVGPLGSKLFDSAVSVSSGPGSSTWVLEFVDFGGELRRDVWHAFINEIISLYGFIREYGPKADDPSTYHLYGARGGRSKAMQSAANGIARLQCLQFIKKLSEDPGKLMQFSYLRNVPHGDVVLQTLAVNFWGGPLVTKFRHTDKERTQMLGPSEGREISNAHLFDIDGSAYLRSWMRSPSWATNSSVLFWKNTSARQGIVLSKILVVADLNLIERAARTCREKSQIVERTQATIDAAMIKGIPSNIDLFKELMLPFVIVANNFERLRHWEEPRLTMFFLAFAYTIIFRNLLRYVLPVALITTAISMLLLKGLREQGRLGRSFGKVTIRDQPPSNTIQKIIALKDAMADMEYYLQNLNITLLKFRTIVLSGQPEISTEVALVLICGAAVLLVVPFKYVLSFVILDLFTRELEFRREMVARFRSFLKDRWAAVHASPVAVLPYEGDEHQPSNLIGEGKIRKKPATDG